MASSASSEVSLESMQLASDDVRVNANAMHVGSSRHSLQHFAGDFAVTSSPIRDFLRARPTTGSAKIFGHPSVVEVVAVVVVAVVIVLELELASRSCGMGTTHVITRS